MNEPVELSFIFASDSAKNGGVIRRSVKNLVRIATREQIVEAVRTRRFHMVETGGQFVIFCHDEPLRLIC